MRCILHSFARSAYVGYTATPFANIFIHERGATKSEGPDLFPAGFIANLAAPSDYVGAARVFGRGEKTAGGARDDLNLVRTIDDHSTDESTGWMPVRHKNGHLPRFQGRDMLPPSLNEAIDAFLLACTARRLRGHANRHSSMLIHVTRFNSVQNEVYRQVVARVGFLRQRLRRRIGVVRILERMESLWQRDFAATTHRVGETDPELVPRNDMGVALFRRGRKGSLSLEKA